MKTKQPIIVIIGGGWAGLSAATLLVNKNVEVVLIERSNRLGGRMSSFYDPKFGEWLDNGVHLFIGAYHNALQLMSIWGVSENVVFNEDFNIPWLGRNGEVYKFKLKENSLATAYSLLKFKGFSFKDRLFTIKGLNALKKAYDNPPIPEPTVAKFLKNEGIDFEKYGSWFEALSLAVLNASAEIAGLYPLIRAMKAGLASGNSIGKLCFFKKPFQQAYIDSANDYLQRNKVKIILNTPVNSVKVAQNERLIEVNYHNCKIYADAVISTVQPLDLLSFLPIELKSDSFFKCLGKMEYSPIIATYLNFERPVLKTRLVHLDRGKALHWVFGRGYSSEQVWENISTIRSYAVEYSNLSTKRIINDTIMELEKRIRNLNKNRLLKARAIINRRATVILKPGSDDIRPKTETPLKGLFLAGDWVATGLPATVESAALSGILSAEASLKSLR